jgi:hypothetical protein
MMWFHSDDGDILKYGLKSLEEYGLKDGSVLVLEIK